MRADVGVGGQHAQAVIAAFEDVAQGDAGLAQRAEVSTWWCDHGCDACVLGGCWCVMACAQVEHELVQRRLLSEVDASNGVLRSLFDSCEEQGTGGAALPAGVFHPTMCCTLSSCPLLSPPCPPLLAHPCSPVHATSLWTCA